MKRGESKSRSQRQLRIGEVIRHVLVQLIDRGEANDPGLDGVSITVTEVRVSPDLRNATAFVMPLGGTGSDEILESLNRAAPFFRRRVAAEVDLRRLPSLSFELDATFDNADHIEALLRSPAVSADVTAPRDPDPDPDTDIDTEKDGA
ncbi:MAG: 30S ribosome-binding factor RbfA [Rhodospirillaceae bacterium]|nr:30S ribosome-binding factor RbfA [Rhodospirillaceae bacterium]